MIAAFVVSFGVLEAPMPCRKLLVKNSVNDPRCNLNWLSNFFSSACMPTLFFDCGFAIILFSSWRNTAVCNAVRFLGCSPCSETFAADIISRLWYMLIPRPRRWVVGKLPTATFPSLQPPTVICLRQLVMIACSSPLIVSFKSLLPEMRAYWKKKSK